MTRSGPSARSARCSWNGASRASASSKNDPYVIVDDEKLGVADMTLGGRGRGFGDGWIWMRPWPSLLGVGEGGWIAIFAVAFDFGEEVRGDSGMMIVEGGRGHGADKSESGRAGFGGDGVCLGGEAVADGGEWDDGGVTGLYCAGGRGRGRTGMPRCGRARASRPVGDTT